MLGNLAETASLTSWQQLIAGGDTTLVEGLWDAPKALLIALAQRVTGKNILLLTGVSQEESRLFHDFPAFTDTRVVEFPAWETLPSESIAPSPDIIGERYKVLQEIQASKDGMIILSNLHACLQKLLPPDSFSKLNITLKTGQPFAFNDLLENLSAMGYHRRPVAADKGEYAVRGGIVDVFPVALPDAYRIEFWGDEIASIRRYDPVGQKSVGTADTVSITPAQELELIAGQERLCSILDYLGPNTLVILDDLVKLEDHYASLVTIAGKPTASFSTLDAFLDATESLQRLFLSPCPVEDLSDVKLLGDARGYYSQHAPPMPLSFEMFNKNLQAMRWSHPFQSVPEFLGIDEEGLSGDDIILSLSQLPREDLSLHLLSNSDTEQQHFEEKLRDCSITLPASTQWHRGYLSSGFVIPGTMILPQTEITHRYKIRRQKLRSTYHTAPSEVFDLTPGETIVQLNNGIGKFLGIERRPNNQGIETEFFLIEYAKGAKLYLPIDQAHTVSKYIGANDELPSLHVLGTNRWKRARESTERAIMGYAADLLQTYARREVKGGFGFSPDSEDILSFEDEFPYIETEDQVSAIADVKNDMQSPKSMDRLVCGDVGYGKTEVAMRAAFKAVLDGKQVAILVPTTVLAMQHYDNFVERFANFPVNIAVLSRMRSTKEIHKTLEGIADGSVDIVIGTHRITSKDVVFKDLGLLVIDEEQRFGVRAKEHLKKIKTGVDCLTLSATPIPRTLYMSLLGARDMSVVNTPPQDRLPIKTVVSHNDDNVIKNAILRELARDGQVYFIHNRVETIFETASRLKTLLPHARIIVAHGQMPPQEIDTLFHVFRKGEADILVATTIVENGVDIPNANTIIIDRSDRFGMADLYQLRGRVGRWNRRAYAYFLVPNRALPELVRKRLEALVDVSGYGGGMKVAMRDLELRGAGNILGTEQSGQVAAVGFHLYCKLLKRTIDALQGKIPSILTDAKMEFPVDARLPDEYINEPSLRMEIYHRLGEAITWDDVDDLWREIKDRFGPPPEPAKWLYHITRIRVWASQHAFTLVKLEKASLVAEQKKGKDVTSNRTLFARPKTPQELETSVIKALKHF